MRAEMKSLDQTNFQYAVNAIWNFMYGINKKYKTIDARDFVIKNADTIRILEVNDTPMGLFSYSESPNSFSLNYLILDEAVKKKKAAYVLYSEMKEKLSKKPVIVTIYRESSDMGLIMKKRGKHIGSRHGKYGEVFNFYAIDFKDDVWK